MSRIVLAGAAFMLALANLASSNATSPEGRCHAIAFEGEIVAGQSFAREIGDALTLKFEPQNFGDEKSVLSGWRVALLPALQKGSPDETKDLIYPVNPPLRFNPSQDIGTSYGITAARKLQHAVTYAFVLDMQDYRKIEAAMNDALWPYAARDPQNANATYLTTLESLALGELRFVPLHVVTDHGGQGIQRLRFRVEIAVPNSFKFSRAFSDHPSACPSQRQ